MDFRSAHVFLVLIVLAVIPPPAQAQMPAGDSSSPHHARKSPSGAPSGIDPGLVSNGTYRNKTFAFTCKIPEGWVLRTDELNARDEDKEEDDSAAKSKSAGDSNATQRVLLAAFARPPQARGEDINSSILIAAESASAYPGLKEAAQYFGPVAEIAKAQGFAMNGDPYDGAIGAKTLARADFQKDVGSRVMRQSTLVMLAKGFIVSFTFIAGTEDEVDDLIDGLSFSSTAKPKAH